MVAKAYHGREIYIGTTAERASVTPPLGKFGVMYYDTTVTTFYVWGSGGWEILGGGASDVDAIHDNVATEIYPIARKGAPVYQDVFLIEDSEDSFNKKKVMWEDLPGAGSPTVDSHAIHDNAANEISNIVEKGTPVYGDWMLIEDSDSGNIKKKVLIGNLPEGGGTDDDAIHDNVAAEISAIVEKTTLVGNDKIVIEDSEDSYNKKGAKVSNLPTDWLPVISLRRTTATDDVSNTSWTTVEWEASEQEDWESWENVTNPERVVLDEAGVYLIIAQVVWETDAAGSRFARILRNGDTANEVLEWGDAAAEGHALFRHNLSGIVIASVNDYITLQVYQNSGAALGLLGGAVDREATRLWVVKLKA